MYMNRKFFRKKKEAHGSRKERMKLNQLNVRWKSANNKWRASHFVSLGREFEFYLKWVEWIRASRVVEVEKHVRTGVKLSHSEDILEREGLFEARKAGRWTEYGLLEFDARWNSMKLLKIFNPCRTRASLIISQSINCFFLSALSTFILRDNLLHKHHKRFKCLTCWKGYLKKISF